MSFFEKYGPWAIVTGASSGIGVEFAHQLAALGLNLVLVARRKEAMDILGAQLVADHEIEVRTASIDLIAETGPHEVLDFIKGLDVGLLVNNAGMNCEGAFYRADLERNVNMIKLNMQTPFILAYELGKAMRNRKKSGIIFTGSTSGFQATPYFTHYAATKAYLLSLAESMNYELKADGIDVLALCPGPTESEMSKGIKNNPLLMKAQPVVRLALNKLGKRSFVVPGWHNKIHTWLSSRLLSHTAARNLNGAAMKKFLPKSRKKH